MRARLAAVALLLAASCGGPDARGILGTPPSFGPGGVDAAPNAAAIVQRIWVPALDDYGVPQGLAVAGGDVLVSTFQSRRHDLNKGPCRVYRIDAATGGVRGRIDLPFALPYDGMRHCGHSGGLAAFADGTLVIADTQLLFVTTLDAFDQAAPIVRKLALGDGLTGGVAATSADSLWLGTSVKDKPGQIVRIDLATVKDLRDGATVTAAMAGKPVPIPSDAQGAAFDRDGRLWVARSDIGWARLVRLDPATGAIEADYAVPAATEGIAFAADGRLWAVSEAGARRFYEFLPARMLFPFYPLIYAIDPPALRR
ncbi:MAG: hypothetical protein HY060_15955 [Proteobacteria bacterium]|nr:hypothetical protein [Pseudomonadota bacterium]